MNATRRLLTVLLTALPLHAQPPAGPPSVQNPAPSAEQLFRDAWWAESGGNDVETALRGYLQAVTADGPASTRARSLLFAGRLQQRLGKAEAALAAFRRVVTEFATETAMVDEARTHLRELTAVDLRQNYDEWYERRLFSEEVQLVILGKLEALASRADRDFQDAAKRLEHRQQLNTLINEIQAFGKGAAPALRKYALGAHHTLAYNAIEMLFAIGELPPLAALLRHADVLGDEALVGKMLTMRAKEPMPELPVGDRRAHMLATVLAGPDALTREILTAPPHASIEVQQLIAALLPFPSARAQLLAALRQPGLAVVVREAIENAFAGADSLSFDAEQWLQIAADPLRAELRSIAITHAARVLRPEQSDLLPRLLAAVEDQAAESGHDQMLLLALAGGLTENRIVEVLAWTPARLGKLLACLPATGDAAFAPVLQQLRRIATGRQMLANALFADPVASCRGFRRTLSDEATCEQLQSHFATNLDNDADTALFARRWHAAMLVELTERWPGYDATAQLAAIVLLRGVAVPSERAGLVEFLRHQEGSACADVKAALAQAIELLRN
jgi:hypothetical protein